MPKPKKGGGKPSVDVPDLPADHDPKGGGKKQVYFEIKMEDVLISSTPTSTDSQGTVKK